MAVVIFALLALCAIALLLPILGVTPPVKWGGQHSRSTWFSVEMMPPQYYTDTGQSLHGVYAHEHTHVLTDWMLGVFFMLLFAGVALAVFHDQLAVLAAVPGFLVAYKLSQTDAWDRQSELLAKTVEVEVAAKHGFDRDEYYQAESASTVANVKVYGGILRPGETAAGFEAAMRRRAGLARFLAALQAIPLRKVPA